LDGNWKMIIEWGRMQRTPEKVSQKRESLKGRERASREKLERLGQIS